MRPPLRRKLWGLLGALLLLMASRAEAAVPCAILGAQDAQTQRVAQQIRLDRGLAPSALAEAQLIWVIGALTPTELAQVQGRVAAGASAIVVLGGSSASAAALGLTPVAGSQTRRTTLEAAAAAWPELRQGVVWSTAPQVGARALPPRGQVLVRTRSDQQPVLVELERARGRLWFLALDLSDASNRDLKMWPYFNYLLYVLGSKASGRAPLRYGDWESAPVPGRRALVWLLSIIGAAWVLTLALFFRARTYSLRHPQLLTSFFPRERPAVAGSLPKAASLWQQIGFARPLAGFLTLTAALLLLFVPFYWLTNIVMPNQVQPFPQARGMWDFAWESLQVAWFLFDAGTFVAFIKYFAEFRVKDPAEALRSAQFFVWWQILTGLVQVTLASVAAVVILPNTRYGFSSSFVILVALGQYPGFFGVVTFFFQAYQRYDYNIALDLLSDWVLRFALTVPFILIFRSWGAAHPAYGEAFGAAIGLGVGFHVASLLTFGIGVWLYRRLGLSLLPLFLVHFTFGTAKRMLWYGLRVVAGKFLFRAAQAVDKVMISLLLVNYTEWIGLHGQIHANLMFLFPIAYRFFETAMAALSESYSNQKRVLTQYYLVRFFQVGSIYAAIALSLLLALGPLFVAQVMQPQWARAAEFLWVAGIIGALAIPAWLSDMLQKGAGRPGLFAMVLGAEQLLRIGLFILLVPALGFWGFYLALLLAIVTKVCGGWLLNHLLVLRVRLFPYQMFIAPALAGLLNFALWRLVALGLGSSGAVVVSTAFFCASLLSFVLTFFFVGLVGGYDQAFRGELEQASTMTGALRPITRLFYHAAAAGLRLSPWHDRFPVSIAAEAAAEGRELEAAIPQQSAEG